MRRFNHPPELISFSLALLCVLAVALMATDSIAAGEGKYTQYPPVVPYSEVIGQLKQARESAGAKETLLLIVLGANWCHDSRGFVDRMREPEFARLLTGQFEPVLINLGFLADARKIMAFLDVPVMFGTPTVLVMDPVTGAIMNRDSYSLWRNADSISMDETERYFEAFQGAQARLAGDTGASSNTGPGYAPLADFERRQGQRIFDAYEQIAPALERVDRGEEVAGFYQQWNQLYQMRSQLAEDLPRLRLQVAEQARAGGPISLDWPAYPLFSDAPAAPSQ